MGIKERLENLVANPLVVDSTDYDFARGLLEYYNKRGYLTAGRRPWLDKLEAKYDPATYVDPLAGNPQGACIVALLEREESFADRLLHTGVQIGAHNPRVLWDRIRIAQHFDLRRIDRAFL